MKSPLVFPLLLAVLGVAGAAPSYQPVVSFAQPPRVPQARVFYRVADGCYYGTTTRGGACDLGAVFRVTPAGVVTSLVSFTGGSGSARGEGPDAGLVAGPDGALYGATVAGGLGGYGTLFKVTAAGVFTTLVDFTGTGGAAKGSVPGELVLASDGNFYGTTEAGGANDCGTVFRLTPGGTLTTLVEFSGTSGSFRGTGPVGPLVAGGTVLYGVTQYGGPNVNSEYGTVFQFNLATSTFATLVQFTGLAGARPGACPAAGLCLHADGALYGTTEYGGANDAGVAFRLVATGASYAVRHVFGSGDDGVQPAGTLVVGGDGALYGTTTVGGDSGYGVVYRLAAGAAASPAVTVLADFTGSGGAYRGANPRAALTPGPDGILVGTASGGGAGDEGTVFTITTAGAFLHLADFTNESGWEVAGGVAFDGSGDMLVPMQHGGAGGRGTLVRVTPGGMAGVEAVFGGMAGEEPEGSLLRHGADFYGLARDGGSAGRGAFFRYSPGLATTVLSHLTNTGGSLPESPLMLGPDGNFYGVAREGGTSGKGTILRLSPAGARVTLVSFNGVSGVRGARPRAPLALGSDGNFYGVTEKGGLNDRGTVFRLTPAGTLTTLIDFAASPSPNSPLGGLVLSPDGNFYGTCGEGGAAGRGAVVRLTPGGTLTTVAEFTGSGGLLPGGQPAGVLLAALDGTLYGTAARFGGNGWGVLYRIPAGGPPALLFNFTGTVGTVPGSEARGELVFGPDGLLHGVARAGGPAGGGVVFRVSGLGPHAGTDGVAYPPGAVNLQGRAQTGGEPTTVSFDYGSTPSLGSSVPAMNALTQSGVQTFSATLAGLAPGTTYYFRARAVNASGVSTGLIRTFTVPATPMEAWKATHLGDTNAPDLGDADGDGSTNLSEYALLGVPNVPDRAACPAPQAVVYPEGRRLALFLQRDPARNDITIEVQAAGEAAGPWTTIASSSLGAPFSGPGYMGGDGAVSGVRTVEIRDVVNLDAAPRRWLRVRVTH